jgi:hypothetical protein
MLCCVVLYCLLAECREDLKRDEEIFGEKVLELKQTRRAVSKPSTTTTTTSTSTTTLSADAMTDHFTSIRSPHRTAMISLFLCN